MVIPNRRICYFHACEVFFCSSKRDITLNKSKIKIFNGYSENWNFLPQMPCGEVVLIICFSRTLRDIKAVPAHLCTVITKFLNFTFIKSRIFVLQWKQTFLKCKNAFFLMKLIIFFSMTSFVSPVFCCRRYFSVQSSWDFHIFYCNVHVPTALTANKCPYVIKLLLTWTLSSNIYAFCAYPYSSSIKMHLFIKYAFCKTKHLKVFMFEF